MPFLLPSLIHHAVMEKKNLAVQQQIAATQQAQYELLLAEHNAHCGANVTVKKGVLAHKGNNKH
jgi:hypothetical protein